MQDRQQERGGLAAARLGAREDVPALQGGRDRVALNRRRTSEAEVFDGAKQVRMELKSAESQEIVLVGA
jgi:hypothetical protein